MRSALWILLAAAALTACDLNPPEPLPSQAPPHMITSPGPTATPSPTLQAVWILWPLGVNVHQSPATDAPVAAAAEQTQELDVDGSRVVDGKTWLQVHSASDETLKGWVLDDPGLVIHRSIDLQINSDQSWSMAFPTGWNVMPASGPSGPTTATGDGQTLTVDVESPNFTFKAPAGWTFVKDQEIELYGKTTPLATYKTPTGYEFVTNALFSGNRHFTVHFDVPAAAGPDPSLALQLITGIKVDKVP